MKTHLLIFVFCFIVSQAFAAPDVLNDNTIAEKDTFLVEKKELIQNNKTESFHLCYLLSVGFNFDSSISDLDGIIAGTSIFDSKRLLAYLYMIRLDVKEVSKHDTERISRLSIINPILDFFLGASIIFTQSNKKLTNILLHAMWINAGGTEFILLGTPFLSISLTESHAFKWYFIENHYYDNKKNEKEEKEEFFYLNDIGYSMEFGIKANIFPVSVIAGWQAEATTKNRNFGWYIRILAIPMSF